MELKNFKENTRITLFPRGKLFFIFHLSHVRRREARGYCHDEEKKNVELKFCYFRI